MKFGLWTVLREVEPHNKVRFIKVKCSCSDKTIKEVNMYSLVKGISTSCGCYAREASRERRLKESDVSGRHDPLFGNYDSMTGRARRNERYKSKGITVCREWLEPNGKGFQNFKKWAIAKGWFEGCGLSIERKDNAGNYEPGNCKWATAKQQARNRDNNTSISYDGKTLVIAKAVEVYGSKGLTQDAYLERIKRGWTIKEALVTPVGEMRNSKKIKFKGNLLSLVEIIKKYGLPELGLGTVKNRLESGWNIEDAISTPSLRGKRISFKGESLSPTELIRKHGVAGLSLQAFNHRIKKNWSIKQALKTPIGK